MRSNMKIKNTVLTAILFLSSLFVLSCKSNEYGPDTVDINGMVYDFSNRPVPNCEIFLGGKYAGITDINGRFSFLKIPAGTYTVTGSKIDFETYTEEITVKERGQIIYIRIPSMVQLLNLTDEALTANNQEAAMEMVERVFRIDNKNTEALFYAAAILFRQKKYDEAIMMLETAKETGTRDPYVEKFLANLKELYYAN